MNYETELGRTADRLRQLTDARLLAHTERFYALLAVLAGREVPQVDPRAWADQLLVVGREVPEPRRAGTAVLLTDFRRGLDLRT